MKVGRVQWGGRKKERVIAFKRAEMKDKHKREGISGKNY